MRRGTVLGHARQQPAAPLVVLALALGLTGCSADNPTADRASASASTATTSPPSSNVPLSPLSPLSTSPPSPSQSGSVSAEPSASPSTDAVSYAVADPGPLRSRLLTSDVLVTSPRTIPVAVRRAVRAVPGVDAALSLSLASLSVDGRTLSVAAADPSRFRRYTPYATAQSDEVWSRVAGGEIAVDPTLPARLADAQGSLALGTADDAPAVHIGAYAPMMKQNGSTLPPISGVVNDKRGRQLGLPVANAMLVSTGETTPSRVTGALKRVLGADTTMATLALEFHLDNRATAVLSGGSVSQAVGTFSYTPHADGTVTPDPGWVREYIRRETMPIIGPVTGNKGMLPQLRAALAEVVQVGLADRIHPGEYGGCYVPRFIAHDPGKGLSLHSWGMAVDLNVPGNLRGTSGEMDRRVVAIFKRWGFAWGGDWSYTDPMHFEMASVVRAN